MYHGGEEKRLLPDPDEFFHKLLANMPDMTAAALQPWSKFLLERAIRPPFSKAQAFAIQLPTFRGKRTSAWGAAKSVPTFEGRRQVGRRKMALAFVSGSEISGQLLGGGLIVGPNFKNRLFYPVMAASFTGSGWLDHPEIGLDRVETRDTHMPYSNPDGNYGFVVFGPRK